MSRFRPKPRSAVILLLAVPLLLVVYVLSSGPMWRLALHGEIDYETYDAVYGMVERISDSSSTIDAAYEQYLQLWTPDDLPTFYSSPP